MRTWVNNKYVINFFLKNYTEFPLKNIDLYWQQDRHSLYEINSNYSGHPIG